MSTSFLPTQVLSWFFTINQYLLNKILQWLSCTESVYFHNEIFCSHTCFITWSSTCSKMISKLRRLWQIICQQSTSASWMLFVSAGLGPWLLLSLPSLWSELPAVFWPKCKWNCAQFGYKHHGCQCFKIKLATNFAECKVNCELHSVLQSFLNWCDSLQTISFTLLLIFTPSWVISRHRFR